MEANENEIPTRSKPRLLRNIENYFHKIHTDPSQNLLEISNIIETKTLGFQCKCSNMREIYSRTSTSFMQFMKLFVILNLTIYTSTNVLLRKLEKITLASF